MVGGPRPERLPLFPLAQVVLFPRTRLPLHVFEPRYRQLTEAALAGDRCIGMVAVCPDWIDALAGDPPVYPVGCAGRIERSERLADGRYELLLAGIQRFRIRSEPPRPAQQLYRVAEVEWLEDPLSSDDGARVAALRSRIVELIDDLVHRSGRELPKAAERLTSRLAELDDATFADALSQSLAFPSTERQGLLEADGTAARLEQLAGLLRFRVHELRAGGGGASRTLQ